MSRDVPADAENTGMDTAAAEDAGTATEDAGAETESAEDAGTPTEAVETDPASGAPDVEDGRYVYCVVRAGLGDTIEAHGVDDEPVRLVAVPADDEHGSGAAAPTGGDEPAVAAVVHDCESVYDSADPTAIRRWLVGHQRVVDQAGESFGTPLPFQFDTIVRGGDDGVREWLRAERATLAEALAGLAGHWEYRIEVARTDPVSEETLLDEDERLATLREAVEAAGPGRAHLLEKRYRDRLKGLRSARGETLTEDVIRHVEPHVREVHELDPSPTQSIAGKGATDDGETVCRLTVLAHGDDEAALGSALDEVAAEPGVEVRFTGPWPPYTFTPTFDGSDQSSGRRG